MSSSIADPQLARRTQPQLRFWKGLREIAMFFKGKDEVHKSMRRLIKRLEKAGTPYALVGGLAVFAHKYRRTTNDVAILVTATDFARFRKLWVPKNYVPHPRLAQRFVDRVNQVTIDFLITGLFPGSGKPGPIAYPNPIAVSEVMENAKVIDLPTLINLKLAARRHQDYADVVNLIRFNDLDASFQVNLHPSVRADYEECVAEKLREDDYIARQDRAVKELQRKTENTQRKEKRYHA